MKIPSSQSGRRIFFVFWGLILGLSLIAMRVVYVDARYSEKLIQRKVRQSKRIIKLPARRGTIYDVNGNILAMDVPSQSLFAIPNAIHKKVTTAMGLSEIFGIDKARLQKMLSKDAEFVWIKRKVSDAEAAKVKKLNYTGLNFIKDTKRVYPNSRLAASLIGFKGEDEGIEGSEKSYETWLRGEPGYIILEKDAIGRNVPHSERERVEAINGNDVYLTIDRVVQYNAEKEIKTAVDYYKAAAGVMIVMEPDTGRLLALASYPGFDPNRHVQFHPSRYRNLAVSYVYEPGSTMKPLIAAAAVDTGKWDSHKPTVYCAGTMQVGKHIIHDAHSERGGHGHIDLTTIIEKSCNIGIAQVGMGLGPDILREYLKRYGFGQKMNLGLNGEEFGLLPRDEWWDRNITQATVSYGQSISVTPLQLASAYSGVINGGIMMKPQLLDRIVSPNGEVLYTFKPQQVRRVVSERTSRIMRKMMGEVVTKGTGDNARIPRYSVGGKTGTAQIAIGGSYAGRRFVGSFIGFSPVDDPKLLVFSILIDPKAAYYGGVVAAPAFQRVMLQSLLYKKVPPTELDDKITPSGAMVND